MDDFYLIAITALLPLTALMLVLQVNPYQALVMRGILGAIAALTYALLGAADVALTEALVGTMLSITLYAVAVRSSMEMRLGWIEPSQLDSSVPTEADAMPPMNSAPSGPDEILVTTLRKALKQSHLRLELRAYPSSEALATALENKQIHSALQPAIAADPDPQDRPKADAIPLPNQPTKYLLQTRIKRLAEILNQQCPADLAVIEYLGTAQSSAHSSASQRPLVQEPS